MAFPVRRLGRASDQPFATATAGLYDPSLLALVNRSSLVESAASGAKPQGGSATVSRDMSGWGAREARARRR